MIIKYTPVDFHTIYEIINDSAAAYKGVIPADRWHDPYTSQAELKGQIEEGVEFWAYVEEGLITGVMGMQFKGLVTLIRHTCLYANVQMEYRHWR